MEQDRKELLSLEQVAKILHIHTQTVSSLVRRGELRAYRVANRLRFDPDDVEEYLRKHQVKPTETDPDERPY